jgi:hypothetical protein
MDAGVQLLGNVFAVPGTLISAMGFVHVDLDMGVMDARCSLETVTRSVMAALVMDRQTV